jgi:quaternary ammonium compound-resistance protein SugE
MHWIYLFLAGLFEIGWPLGFKLSQITHQRFLWLFLAIISMSLSGYFLWIAQKEIPIGTAYAIWTGMGAAGTFLIGIIFFKDSTDWLRLLSFFLIVLGIIGLKVSN